MSTNDFKVTLYTFYTQYSNGKLDLEGVSMSNNPLTPDIICNANGG